jgi:uncharacterized protein (DUF2225 family)
MFTGGASPTPTSSSSGEVGSVKLRKLVTGQTLMREGDPPGPIYVICAGRLRVYRRDLTAVNAVVDLATLGTGEVIGELGPILGKLRSATVQAVESTQVLEIPAEQLAGLVEHHQPLVRVILTALRERSDLPQADIAKLAARLGLSPSPEPEASPPTPTGVSVPAHDSTVVYPKTVDCPSCGTQFSTFMVRPRKDQPADRESDFHNTYRTTYNPYDYEPWVCPNDLYAALPGDFADLAERHVRQVAPIIEQVVADWGDELPEFNADRTLDLRQRALELALALYQMRDLPPIRLAAVTHRLAWCSRERGDLESEQKWLSRALEHYIAAHAESDPEDAKEELRIQFLCGELSLRLGDVNAAVTWFASALRHPGLKDHANWERMLRDQWAVAREQTQN